MSRYNFNNNNNGGNFQGFVPDFNNWRDPNMSYQYNNQHQQRPQQNFGPQRGGRPHVFRGRGGRRGGISNNPKANVRNPVELKEETPKPTTMPTGQHLSKTNSEFKNDPLYLEAFMPSPSEELVPIAEELNHFPGFDGLTTLIEETYENFSAHNLNFKRSISLSAYSYYITVLAWARALYLKKLNKYKLTTYELEFIEMIYEQGNFLLPKSVVIYLSGFGNFNIPSGVESKFNLKPYTYNELGYFNDFDTKYYLCTDYPNIAISAERVMRDLAYTENPDIGEAWSPNEIEQDWNSRCIGYAPSTILSDMQCAVLDRAFVRSDNFPSDLNGFLVNVRLMNNVQKYLSEIPSLESGPIPKNLTGSLGQFIIEIPTVSVGANDEIGSLSFTSKSPLSCPGSMSFLGGSFLYRVDKDLTPARRKYFYPYTKDSDTQEDKINLNLLNTGWSPIFNQIYHYSNVPFKPVLRVKKFCSIDVKPSGV